ncbi:MAG: hypothetical protein Q3987_08950 [Oscillospiraceae bacterium]|nr:hypothetical protein [Oscillospiraceae bacterium]
MKTNRTVINKILYTVGNDLALFGLIAAVYYLPRIIPYNLALILLIIFFITAVFCFYLVRVFTVIGDFYDEDYNAVYVLLKLIFLFLNIFAIFVFFAPPVIAFTLIGINTVLISGTQYLRIIKLMLGRYESFDGLVLSAERKIVRHGGSGPRRGYSTINYLVEFERNDGRCITICVDFFTYLRIKRPAHATLVLYQFPGGRVFGEVIAS